MWDNLEEAFAELDKEEYSYLAKPLAAYFQALQREGFNEPQAFRLVEAHARFIYHTSLLDYFMKNHRHEEILSEEDLEDAEDWENEDEEDEDVDSDDDDLVL